jgi:predicted Zn-dependent peptidase
MAFQLEGVESVVDKLLWLCLYGRDPSWLERFDDTINALTLNDVNTALREHLYSPHVSIVAVGDSDVILPQLATFGEVATAHFRDNP